MIEQPLSRLCLRRRAALSVLGFALCAPALAFNYVGDANGTFWGIQDFAPPRVDTGSIRATQVGFGQQAPYSTSINGFGGIRVLVPRPAAGVETAFNGAIGNLTAVQSARDRASTY
jgi:amidase